MAACRGRQGREKTHRLDHRIQVRTLSEKNVEASKGSVSAFHVSMSHIFILNLPP